MRHISPPDLSTILEDLKSDVFSNLNCIQIGKIQSYDLTTETASIQIQMKKELEDNTLVSYPVLVDCPVIILQGGGAFLEMPIQQDDYCLIFFNDRDIDNWWLTANVKEPNTTRKHNLSDGIALIGLNPKSNVLSLIGNIVRIFTNDNPFKIDAGDGEINIINKNDITLQTTQTGKKIILSAPLEIDLKDAMNINLLAATQSFVKGDLTNSQFDTLMTAIKTHTHAFSVVLAPSGTYNGVTVVPGNAGAMSNPISLSTKIKGE
jgi:hypothetical protein